MNFHYNEMHVRVPLPLQFLVRMLVRTSDEKVCVSRLVFGATFHGASPSSHPSLQQSALPFKLSHFKLVAWNIGRFFPGL